MKRYIKVTFNNDFIFEYKNINKSDLNKIKTFFYNIKNDIISCGFDLNTLNFELNNFKPRGKTKRIKHKNELFSFYYGKIEEFGDDFDFITQFPLRQSCFISHRMTSLIQPFFDKNVFIKESLYFKIKLKKIYILVDKSDCEDEKKELVSLLEKSSDFDIFNVFKYALVNKKNETLTYLIKSEKIINTVNNDIKKYDFLSLYNEVDLISYLKFENKELIKENLTTVINEFYNLTYKEEILLPFFKYNLVNYQDMRSIEKNIFNTYESLYNKYILKLNIGNF